MAKKNEEKPSCTDLTSIAIVFLIAMLVLLYIKTKVPENNVTEQKQQTANITTKIKGD